MIVERPWRGEGVIVTRTPLRVSFAGGGTDLPAYYETGFGAVFSTAIDKYVYVTVKRHGDVFDERVRLNYSVSESVSGVEAIRNDIARECLRLLEIEPPIYVSVVSDLPDSSGLGGSSAFAVGLLHALHMYRGERVSAGQLAEEAGHVEMGMLRQPIGKQDQYAAAFGGLNLFRFNSNGRVTVEPQRVRHEVLATLFEHLLMVWTGHQRRASAVLAEQQAATPARVDELTAMRDQAYGLQDLVTDDAFDLSVFARVLHEGWERKRRLASTVSNDILDRWYRAGLESGALGGKLCGAGGGGFFLFVVPPDRRDAVCEALGGLTAVPIRYEAHGSRVLLPNIT